MTAAPGTRHANSIAIIGVLFSTIGLFAWINGPLITFVKLAVDLHEVEAFLAGFAFTNSCFVLALPATWALKRTGLIKDLALTLLVMPVGAAFWMRASLRNPLP